MTVVKAKAIVIVVTLVAALMGASASAQQPASATPQPTPAALRNPNWCSQVPASPPPPYFEHHPGAWAAERQMCMNLDKNDRACASICINAIDRWNLQKAGRFNQPDTFPSLTDQPQGPFPLPGGANGYILPVQPAPAPSDPTSDAADAVSAALMGASASAQSPSAAPTTNAPVGSIPEMPPQWWTADGGTQGQWTAMREHCRAVFSEVAAIQKMSPEQIKALTPVPASDWESCRRISGSFSGAVQASGAGGPAPTSSRATPPTPMNTPPPPEFPVGPQSLKPGT